MGLAGIEFPGIELLATLGRGGQARVLLGRYKGEECAVKVPLSTLDNDAFLREACALARVSHPALPKIVEFKRDGGTCCLLLERVRGETLRQRVARLGHLPLAEVVQMTEQLAGALAAVHRCGISHGDLCPENCLFDDSSGRVRLIDFGRSAELVPATGKRRDLDALAELIRYARGCPGPDAEAKGPIQEPATLALDTAADLLVIGDESVDELALLERVVRVLRPFVPGEDQRLAPKLCGPQLRGREEELEQIRKVFARGTGVLRGALVLGAPGSGKSALFGQVGREQREDGVPVLHVVCRESDSRPYAALRLLLKCMLASPSWGQERVLELAGNLLPLLRELVPQLPGSQELNLEASVTRGGDSQIVYLEGLTRFVTMALGAVQGVTLVIDDLHWIDASSAMVLRRAFRRLEVPLNLLIGGRPSGTAHGSAHYLLEGLVSHSLTQIDLGRLSSSSAAAMIQDYLGELPLPREHQQALARLSDGTPLGVLEVVRAVLDDGLLVPRVDGWELDVAGVASVRLPREAVQLLRRRLRLLSEGSLLCLSTAAVLGAEFSRVLLLRLREPALVDAALSSGVKHILLRPSGRDSYAFVHDSVRRSLLHSLDAAERLKIHREAATLLANAETDRSAGQGMAQLYEAATHAKKAADYAPELAAPLCLNAGRCALERYDNARALGFLLTAERARVRMGLAGSADLVRYIAEAQLRQGDVPSSLSRFQESLELEGDPAQRAHIYSRMAWIHEVRYSFEDANSCLERGLEELGAPQPGLAPSTLWNLCRLSVTPPGRLPSARTDLSPEEATRYRVLADLYAQCFSLATYTAEPARIFGAAARNIQMARHLGASPGLSRAYGVQSFILLATSKYRAMQYLNHSKKIAEELQDPVSFAHCLVLRCAMLTWLGRDQEAVEVGAQCLTQHGHWLDVPDFFMVGCSLSAIESLRGRGLQSWHWVEQMLEKASHHEGGPIFSELLVHMTLAAAAHLGKTEEYGEQVRLARSVCAPVPKGSKYYPSTLPAKIQFYTETGDLGVEFEALVLELRKQKINPRRAHLLVILAFVYIAHARVHQLLTDPKESDLEPLNWALDNLRLGARIPTFKAHRVVIEGYHHFFAGRLAKAERKFAAAEKVARPLNAPWILYCVARGRAHLLKKEGHEEAALEQARIAAGLAKGNGSVHRHEWVCAEFDISRMGSAGASGSGRRPTGSGGSNATSQARRHLRALIQVSQAASGDLAPERQAVLVLDELIEALRAQRGYLLHREQLSGAFDRLLGVRGLKTIVARERGGVDVRAQMSEVQELAVADAIAHRDVQIRRQPGIPGQRARSVIAAPLVVQDQLMGAIVLDSTAADNTFDSTDGEVLRALAAQVPVTLELAKLLRDRERLEGELRHAQKMEAVGRLAGGIAHDFNNMLAAITISTDSVLLDERQGAESREDLLTIKGAAQQASRLTRQLLAFSRRQVLEEVDVDVSAVVTGIIPMLQRLLGEGIAIRAELDDTPLVARLDAGQLEQAIVNLALNARDAMSAGGELCLTTSACTFGEAEFTELPAGKYVRLTVVDTGAGMEPETAARVFEPFFTTKDKESGTGLGLSMVYGFVRQSGGQIDVASKPGAGARFSIVLPRCGTENVVERPLQMVTRNRRGAGERILLVEDEALVRQALTRVLERLGYVVWAAADAQHGLRLAAHNPRPDLVITDIVMPGMNGVQLVDELRRRGLSSKVLYISGYIGDKLNVAPEDFQGSFLRKPIAQEELALRVRDLLGPVGATVYG